MNTPPGPPRWPSSTAIDLSEPPRITPRDAERPAGVSARIRRSCASLSTRSSFQLTITSSSSRPASRAGPSSATPVIRTPLSCPEAQPRDILGRHVGDEHAQVAALAETSSRAPGSRCRSSPARSASPPGPWFPPGPPRQRSPMPSLSSPTLLVSRSVAPRCRGISRTDGRRPVVSSVRKLGQVRADPALPVRERPREEPRERPRRVRGQTATYPRRG